LELVVVVPDDLVAEVFDPENLVEHELREMTHVPIKVDIDGAGLVEQFSKLNEGAVEPR
jgi:hypothetical protein